LIYVVFPGSEWTEGWFPRLLRRLTASRCQTSTANSLMS